MGDFMNLNIKEKVARVVPFVLVATLGVFSLKAFSQNSCQDFNGKSVSIKYHAAVLGQLWPYKISLYFEPNTLTYWGNYRLDHSFSLTLGEGRGASKNCVYNPNPNDPRSECERWDTFSNYSLHYASAVNAMREELLKAVSSPNKGRDDEQKAALTCALKFLNDFKKKANE
jgi:hypothetical protein